MSAPNTDVRALLERSLATVKSGPDMGWTHPDEALDYLCRHVQYAIDDLAQGDEELARAVAQESRWTLLASEPRDFWVRNPYTARACAHAASVMARALSKARAATEEQVIPVQLGDEEPGEPITIAEWDVMGPEEQDALIASGWHPGPERVEVLRAEERRSFRLAAELTRAQRDIGQLRVRAAKLEAALAEAPKRVGEEDPVKVEESAEKPPRPWRHDLTEENLIVIREDEEENTVRVEEPAGEPDEAQQLHDAIDAVPHKVVARYRVAQSANADVRGALLAIAKRAEYFNETAPTHPQNAQILGVMARDALAALPVPVGDETEALTREQYAWSCAEDMRGWAIRAEAKSRDLRTRIAGLEAREAALRDALADDLRWAIEVLEAAAPPRDQDEGHYANRALVYLHDIRGALADSGEAGS